MNDRLQQVLSGKEGSYVLPFFWPWEGNPEMAEPEIEKIYACGIREICVEARPFEEFGKEGWWTYMDAILTSASARNMKVWILDDKHFPTGYANGLLEEKHPELQRHYLREHHVDVLGPARESSVLVPPCREGEKLLGIVAYRRSEKGEEICGQPILLEKEEIKYEETDDQYSDGSNADGHSGGWLRNQGEGSSEAAGTGNGRKQRREPAGDNRGHG